MKISNKSTLRLALINENNISKHNNNNTYVLYKTIFSDDINIGLIDNYLTLFSPTLSNTEYLDYATSKAYFYDVNNTLDYYDSDIIYDVKLTADNTIADSTIIKGNISLNDTIDNYVLNQPKQNIRK